MNDLNQQTAIRQRAVKYAQSCRAWYGDKARDVALGQLEEQRRLGNQTGVLVWELAANELARLDGRDSVRFS